MSLSDLEIRPRGYRGRAAARYLGTGLTSVYKLVKTGELPPPIKLAGNISIFPVEDLDALVDRRKAERDATLAEGGAYG